MNIATAGTGLPRWLGSHEPWDVRTTVMVAAFRGYFMAVAIFLIVIDKQATFTEIHNLRVYRAPFIDLFENVTKS